MKSTLVRAVLFWTVASGLCADARAGLQSQIDAIVRRNAKVDFSICVMDAQTDRVVYQHHAKRSLIPASNMKIVTSAAALHYLGPNFEFVTRVGLSGDTLIVIGSGDPLLGDTETDEVLGRAPGWFMREILAGLRKVGRRRIIDLLIDSTVFDDQRVHPRWSPDELNRSYACEVCGLNFNGNCISIRVRNAAGRIAVLIEPDTRFVSIKNRVRAIQSGAQAVGAYRIAGRPNHLEVRGKCKTEQGPFDVAIENPAIFFGFLLAEFLGSEGISLQGQIVERGFAPSPDWQPVALCRTPLSECLKRCNKDSFNLVAEALLKEIGVHANGGRGDGSWAQGSLAVEAWLQNLGIEPSEYVIDDGSGLSRANRLSANAIVSVLRSVYRGEHWDYYQRTLAIGGVDGTMKKFFRHPRYQGKFKGKTGYIDRVRGFSGVCHTSGKDFLFSILANNANNIRSVVNSIAEAIVDTH